MDKIDTLTSNPKYAESASLEPKNGITMLPCSVSSVFQGEPKNVEQLHELICNTEQVKNVRELILTHTDLQTLPDIFNLNFENLTHLNLEGNKLSQLPLNMKNLMKLQHLNLSHNCLKVLSDEIGNLSMLQTLKLENNSLVELPDSVCKLMNLQQLSIANNSLRILPNDIGDLVKLETLVISGNMLEDLPGSLLQLTNLCHFIAASNMLSYLSESFTHLNKLRTLNLSKNSMYEVPYCLFTGLPNISVLDLSYNYIDNFSEAPNCVSKLRSLKLDHNGLLTIPRWIFQDTCKCLLQLNISHNTCMTGISNEVFMSKSNLKRLDISNCRLTTNNVVFLRGLRSLEYLNMGNSEDFNNVGNAFWDLPMSDLKNSCSLQNLTLCSVGLAAVPDDFIQLSRLQHLDLSSNYLMWLPDTFSDLVQLKSCRLSNNGLALLPVQLGKLEELKELSLDDNKVCSWNKIIYNGYPSQYFVLCIFYYHYIHPLLPLFLCLCTKPVMLHCNVTSSYYRLWFMFTPFSKRDTPGVW
jgi:Leucine-rich repeat (LRR) protein